MIDISDSPDNDILGIYGIEEFHSWRNLHALHGSKLVSTHHPKQRPQFFLATFSAIQYPLCHYIILYPIFVLLRFFQLFMKQMQSWWGQNDQMSMQFPKPSQRILPTAPMWCSLIIRLQQFPELLFKLCGCSTSVVVLFVVVGQWGNGVPGVSATLSIKWYRENMGH